MNRKLLLLTILTCFLAGVLISIHLPAQAALDAHHYVWTRHLLDSQNDVGSYLSMASSYGATSPTIAYYDATAKDLKIAYEAPGNCAPDLTWTCEILDGVSSTDVGQWVSLAYNGADYGVVYFDNYFSVNRYTYPAGGIFGEVIELIPGSVVGQVNSLIYQNNTAHVVYYRDVAGGRFGFAASTDRTGFGAGDGCG